MAVVTDFSEAELWYIYEALTTGTFVGATQQEIWEIFNGTNPQGNAISLFNSLNGESIANQLSETLSGGDTTLANLMVTNVSGQYFGITEFLNQFIAVNQVTGNNSLSSIDTKLTTETTNTGNISTYLSTIRTPFLTSITGSLTIAVQIHNLSVYNSGSSAGTINVDGGGAISIPAGVTVNFDAGGNNNRYAINKFVLNATGTTFLVSYTQ